MQPLIRKHSYLNHRYPVGSMRGGGRGGARGQNLELLQKVVFLCWSFLEVYIFANTYQKAFIVGPKVPYHTLPYPYPYLNYPTLTYLTLPFLYPRHLCRGVYSFRFSVRMFVRSFVRLFVRSFVRTSFRRVEFASKFCVKVSQVVYISATTHQKAFIFGP